jgi:CheY-like chemotaxis protein
VKHPLILIVEPDEHIQRMAKHILEDLGYSVVLASDGKDGLVMAREYLPELIITAALMPVLDGREMCRLIKERPETSGIKVAVMSALYTQQKYHAEAFRRFRVDEYLNKPLKMKDLHALLQKHLPITQENTIAQD